MAPVVIQPPSKPQDEITNRRGTMREEAARQYHGRRALPYLRFDSGVELSTSACGPGGGGGDRSEDPCAHPPRARRGRTPTHCCVTRRQRARTSPTQPATRFGDRPRYGQVAETLFASLLSQPPPGVTPLPGLSPDTSCCPSPPTLNRWRGSMFADRQEPVPAASPQRLVSDPRCGGPRTDPTADSHNARARRAKLIPEGPSRGSRPPQGRYRRRADDGSLSIVRSCPGRDEM